MTHQCYHSIILIYQPPKGWKADINNSITPGCWLLLLVTALLTEREASTLTSDLSVSSQYSTHLSTLKGWKADINNSITPSCWLLLLVTALPTEREASTLTSDSSMSSQYSTHLSTPKGWKADINNSITPGCWLLLLVTALLTASPIVVVSTLQLQHNNQQIVYMGYTAVSTI